MRIVEWAGFKVYEDNIPQNKSGVYVFLNLVNGKYYVGESVELRARIRAHAAGTSPRKFRNALAKYGAHNFLVMPVWYAITQETDKSFQLAVETSLILELDAIENGYNLITDYNRKNWGWADLDNPPDRSWHREFFRNMWNDPVTGPKLRAVAGDPEFQARRIKAIQEAWEDPKLRAEQSATLKEYLSDPEAYKKRVEQLDKIQQVGSDAAKKVVSGSIWITNGIVNRRLPSNQELPEGFHAGRSKRNPMES